MCFKLIWVTKASEAISLTHGLRVMLSHGPVIPQSSSSDENSDIGDEDKYSEGDDDSGEDEGVTVTMLSAPSQFLLENRSREGDSDIHVIPYKVVSTEKYLT